MTAIRRCQAGATLALVVTLSLPVAHAAEVDDSEDVPEPYTSDPLESFNRPIYEFNRFVDRAVIKPLASAYQKFLPRWVRTGVANFFGNLESPIVIVNDLLQGKVEQGVKDAGRFMFNSTFGIFGIFDIATTMQLPRHQEDFGQTLAVWGVGPGWYMVVPFFGPSTVRDFAGGWTVDYWLDPVYQADSVALRNSLIGAETVETRSRIPSAAYQALEDSLDPYITTRTAYLQRRESLVYDGRLSLPELPPDVHEEAPPVPARGPIEAPGAETTGPRLIIR
jgi:phospholipid-binding lipoprotein MlaA